MAKKFQDPSGSCAIVAIILGNLCYVAHTGDSRAILSTKNGKNMTQISKDHRPTQEIERIRIISNKGRLYSTNNGPLRVYPGGLSVSRTFGDIKSKIESFGGKKSVIIAEPDINIFKIDSNTDFLLMGSDGLFERLSNEQIAKIAIDNRNVNDAKLTAGNPIDAVLEDAINKGTTDNITVIIVCFRGFAKISKFNYAETKKIYQHKLKLTMNLPKLKEIINNDKAKIIRRKHSHFYRNHIFQ